MLDLHLFDLVALKPRDAFIAPIEDWTADLFRNLFINYENHIARRVTRVILGGFGSPANQKNAVGFRFTVMECDPNGGWVQTGCLGINRLVRKRRSAGKANGANERRSFSVVRLGVDGFFDLPVISGLLHFEYFIGLNDPHGIDIIGFKVQDFLVAQIG